MNILYILIGIFLFAYFVHTALAKKHNTAAKFKNMRRRVKLYDVETSCGLFGDFKEEWSFSMQVWANNPRQACQRAKKMGYGLRYPISDLQKPEEWASWRVKLHSDSDHFSNIRYY